MTNNKKSTHACRGRLWLLMLLWLPLQALAVAPRLQMDAFTIEAGGTKSVTIALANPDTPVTLLQFDVETPDGLTLMASDEGYAVNIVGRTLWRYHSLQASQLANGSYRVLMSSPTNELIEGTSGAVISLTFKAADSFGGGQLSLKNILMVDPEGRQFEQTGISCQVTAKPRQAAGTSKLNCDPMSINVGDEATMTVGMSNPDEAVTLVQFDVTLPTGITLKSTAQGYDVTTTTRTTQQSHALQTRRLADGNYRVLLYSSSNTPVKGNSGAILQMTLQAAEDFTGGQVTFSNILMVSPDERQSVQASFEQYISAIVPDPVLATGITLSLSKTGLNAGETLQASYVLLPADVTVRMVKWKSSNPAVATVSADGLITALSNGTTTISVETTDGTNLSASEQITVSVIVTSIQLTLEKDNLNAGDVMQASWTVLPANATNKAVTWKSSNENVATVSSSGQISAVGLGTATITVSTTDGSNLSASKRLTVNERVTQEVIDGIGYVCYTWQKKATVKKVPVEKTDKVIPENVTFEGSSYQVTAIADSAFCPPVGSEGYNLSVTIPAGITTLADKAFDGGGIMATVYNGSAKLTQRHLQGIMKESANALLYVKSADVLPANATGHIVVNGTAGDIVLTEQQPFHCPQQFTAKSISLTHHFMMESGMDKTAGWETIVLPFDVESMTHESKGNLIPFAAYTASLDSYMPFWLYEFSSSGFTRASAIQANKPYLVCMPNNSSYTPEYNLNGVVTFAASNATVKPTKAADLSQQTKTQSGKSFVPNYGTLEKEDGGYAINAINAFYTTTGSETPGSIFIRNLRRIGPFEGYFSYGSQANTRPVIDILFAEGTTDIDSAHSQQATAKVYTLSGQLVGTLSNDRIKQLPAGIYMVNGKKVILK